VFAIQLTSRRRGPRREFPQQLGDSHTWHTGCSRHSTSAWIRTVVRSASACAGWRHEGRASAFADIARAFADCAEPGFRGRRLQPSNGDRVFL